MYIYICIFIHIHLSIYDIYDIYIYTHTHTLVNETVLALDTYVQLLILTYTCVTCGWLDIHASMIMHAYMLHTYLGLSLQYLSACCRLCLCTCGTAFFVASVFAWETFSVCSYIPTFD